MHPPTRRPPTINLIYKCNPRIAARQRSHDGKKARRLKKTIARPDRRRRRRRPRRPPPPDDESSAVPTEGERRPRRRPPPLRPLLRREPARVLGRRDGRHVVRTVRQVDAHALVVVRRRIVGVDGIDADAAVSPSLSLPDYVAVASPSRRRPRPTAAVAAPNNEGRPTALFPKPGRCLLASVIIRGMMFRLCG